LIRHEPRFILSFARHFSDHLQEGGQFVSNVLLGRFDAENRGTRFNVLEGFNHEVLALIDEALLDLLDVLFLLVTLLELLDVLACCDLPFALDLFAFQRQTHFQTVCVSIVFADLVQHVRVAVISLQEGLLNLERLNFDVLNFELGVLAVQNEQELLRHRLRLRHADDREQLLLAVVDFGFEAFLRVLDDVEAGVAYPSVDQPLVDGTRLFKSLVASFIACRLVKLFSALSRGRHMNDSLVATITQLNRRPARFI